MSTTTMAEEMDLRSKVQDLESLVASLQGQNEVIFSFPDQYLIGFPSILSWRQWLLQNDGSVGI